MTLPQVSIVMPTYKPAHFEQALRSAIGQTYPNTEILVSDNCPTEQIRDICARFPQVIYQRCSVIRADNVISAFFSGKGQFVKPLFDDDLLHPFCIERMVASATSRPDVELVFSASQVIDANNMRVETRRPFDVSGTMTGLELQRNMTLGMRNFVGEFSSILFRRATLWRIGPHRLFEIGGHDCTNGLADVAAYFNLAEHGVASYIDEELSYFRRDQTLESNSNPASNPNLGYCFSDYIDLLPAAHATGKISTAELLATEAQVTEVQLSLRGIFTQIAPSFERYGAYLQTLKD
ncbi:glycosyltransferase involved in cell wall biosynthesis [Pseudoduganella lurida]|uniref:Glycosyltransferase involved in cell wall biosynthesis n=1 Tax=Pseudoduganella lurida TaxID=1036180 RepID=A0A562QUV9_9BURK|nr:glycosyltransferase [Pseudoduganella lurida]TWI60641.1 glycosyltransferase involved in cell wall biosynthesis [Pseudoduganella lurida]